MDELIRYTDGIEFHLASGETVVADASYPDGDVAIVTHAHSDHLFRSPPEAVVWSECTAALARARRPDLDVPPTAETPLVELHDAGHVPGSRAALIRGERTYLYTGDVSTRDRFHLEGFEPPEADVLVLESTYGSPEYDLPPVESVREAVREWIAAADRPIVCYGYALGRAQEVCRLLADADRDRIFVTDEIDRVNGVVGDHLDVEFPCEPYDESVTLGPGDALVAPERRGLPAGVRSLVSTDEALTAGFSGWAVDESYRYARDLDAAFAISDHCDFGELCDLVEAVDPESVYVTHGSAEAFASHVTRELGYPATALKRNQRTLAEF